MDNRQYIELAQRKNAEASSLAAAQIAREHARVVIQRLQQNIEKMPSERGFLSEPLEIWRKIYAAQDEACARHQASLDRIEMELLRY